MAPGVVVPPRQTFARASFASGFRLMLLACGVMAADAAKGLGEVILAGLGTSDTAFTLRGGVIVGLLAVLVYDGFGLVEARLARRAGRI